MRYTQRLACAGTTLLVTVLLPALAFAAELRPLKTAVGLSLPPYVMAKERRGMEYDIVKEALAMAGYQLDPTFVDFGKLGEELTAGRVAATMGVQREPRLQAHFSDRYITYHNYAMTLASRHLKIDRVEDLAGKSISAFERARSILGPGFAEATKNNPKFTEVAQQYHQNIELFSRKVDVVVADINIFQWYNHDPRVIKVVDVKQKVAYHNIFPPTHYQMAFRDPDIRDAFNRALAELKSSGRYQEIIDVYTSARE